MALSQFKIQISFPTESSIEFIKKLLHKFSNVEIGWFCEKTTTQPVNFRFSPIPKVFVVVMVYHLLIFTSLFYYTLHLTCSIYQRLHLTLQKQIKTNYPVFFVQLHWTRNQKRIFCFILKLIFINLARAWKNAIFFKLFEFIVFAVIFIRIENFWQNV